MEVWVTHTPHTPLGSLAPSSRPTGAPSGQWWSGRFPTDSPAWCAHVDECGSKLGSVFAFVLACTRVCLCLRW